MKSEFLTNQALIDRGWSQDKIDYFLIKNYGNKNSWLLENILHFEKKQKFIEFEKISEILTTKEQYKLVQDELTLEAIERIKTKSEINLNNSLLNVHKKYFEKNSDLDEIIHYPSGNDFSREGKFYAYSDGCGKNINNYQHSSYAGWIEDESGNIVVEFTKELKENKDKFEKFGIETTIELAKILGIKNLSLHTDSRGEAYRIGFNLKYKREKFLEQREDEASLDNDQKLMSDIESFDKFSICYIPREYNSHADSLTKIMIDKYRDKQVLEILKSKNENAWENLTINRDKDLYFNHKSMKLIEDSEEFTKATKWCIYSVKYQNKVSGQVVYNFLVDNETKEIQLYSKLNLKDQYLAFLNSIGVDEEIIKSKINIMDSSLIFNCSVLLNALSNLGEISVHMPSKGFNAIAENLRAVPGKLQEEYYEVHKAMNQFKQVSFGHCTDDITEKIMRHIGEDNRNLYSVKTSKNKASI